MATFRDHFSSHAGDYARWRPSYPRELFSWIASLLERPQVAWDCATGNGQAARGLAAHLGQVFATDASLSQLARAIPHPGVSYHGAEATASGLRAASVDLVTVAQAVHWFDLGPFQAEVRRVLRPGGVLAVWTYERFRVEDEIDVLMEEFAESTVGPFWPPERSHVESGYATLDFEFDPVDTPAFIMRQRWDLPQVAAYLRTWSAVTRFHRARGFDPVSDLEATLAPAWGAPERQRELRWRLPVLAFRF